MKTFKAKDKKGQTAKFFNTQYLIDWDIKGCFDNISHEGLLEHVHMPTGYKYLLEKLLKAPVNYNGSIAIPNKGIPQGGIISPILMNWTLDGLEQLVESTVKKAKVPSHPWVGMFYTKEREEFMIKNNRLEGLDGRRLTEKKGTRGRSWLVRYDDDFIIGMNSQEYIEIVRADVEEFLDQRGLRLSTEKTKVIT